MTTDITSEQVFAAKFDIEQRIAAGADFETAKDQVIRSRRPHSMGSDATSIVRSMDWQDMQPKVRQLLSEQAYKAAVAASGASDGWLSRFRWRLLGTL